MWTQASVDEGIGKDVLMTLYDSMVESYAPKSAAERIAVQQEVMQLIALAGLARGGFFEKAAFYGGTCLHLFYGMERFSEDMDFSLLKPDPAFDFEAFFPAIKEEFDLAGASITATVPIQLISSFTITAMQHAGDIHSSTMSTRRCYTPNGRVTSH